MKDDNDNRNDLTVGGLPMKRRHFLGLLTGGIAATAMGAPLSLLARANANGILAVAVNANPSSLDPATGGAGSDHTMLYPLFDTLVSWDFATLEARPGLAESWSFPDPETLVLTLRRDVTFHDGEPLNAEAVKFNLDRAKNDERSNIQADLVTVDAIEVTGDYEVTLRLNQPDTALPLILSDRAGMMFSPKAAREFGDRSNRNPVGAGPYRFVSWADGDRIVLERYPDYWQSDEPRLEGIEFRIMTDTSTRVRSVISGQSHVADAIDGRQLMVINRSRQIEALNGPSVYCYQLYLNMARGPLRDRRVRQAMNFAINREAFVHATMGGAGEPAYMNLPSDHWAYAPEAKLYEYDPDRARALLEEAGYPDGIELDMRGYPDQVSVQRQELLLEQFAAAGIRGRFRNAPIAEASGRFFGREKEGDILLSAWTGRPDPSLTYSLMYLESSYFNSGRVAPPEGLVEAIADSRRVASQEARREAFARVQKLVMENALVVPLAFRPHLAGYATNVDNLRPNLLGKTKYDGVSITG